MTEQILIVGLGNMAGAMLAGWLAAGENPERFAVLNRTPRAVPDDVTSFATLEDAIGARAHTTLLLGFKPQQLAELAPQFHPLACGDVSVHSLLGGITLDQIVAAFPSAGSHVRVMPNLASRINKSPILLAGRGLDDQARQATISLYDALGRSVWLEDEGQYDLLTALTGSGPGFVYRFIDALAQAGADLGLDPEMAQWLSVETVEGAASLAAGADSSPSELADGVASPGGMTRAGLNVLDEEDALVELLKQTLAATAERGRAISQGE